MEGLKLGGCVLLKSEKYRLNKIKQLKLETLPACDAQACLELKRFFQVTKTIDVCHWTWLNGIFVT